MSVTLADPSKITSQGRALEVDPPLGPNKIKYQHEESSWFDGTFNNPISMEIAKVYARIGGGDYSMFAVVIGNEDPADMAILKQIIGSIRPLSG